jgi:hypothetical protein
LSDLPAQSDYYGQEYELINSRDDLYGVTFRCELNDGYVHILLPNINAGLVPLEYYDFSWIDIQWRAIPVTEKPCEISGNKYFRTDFHNFV